MKFERTGIILFTENYDECVEFYSRRLGLPVINVLDNEHSKLTTLRFGEDTYLMIETNGSAVTNGKTIDQNPVFLRFNVEDVERVAQQLEESDIPVRVRHEVWGTIGDFLDPDGNRCSLREERSFGE